MLKYVGYRWLLTGSALIAEGLHFHLLQPFCSHERVLKSAFFGTPVKSIYRGMLL
jgi:hypothetical protein